MQLLCDAIYHGITYNNAIPSAEHKSYFELTNTLYISHSKASYGVYGVKNM